jgi:phage terminase large subunit
MTQPKTYYDLKNCSSRIAVFQGGSRSGKTFSIITLLIEWCVLHPNSGWVITIVRKSLPSLKGSVMRDFINILQREGYYNERDHNKTESMYDLWGTTWEFLSIDEPQKIRGRKREICFINEANELPFDAYQQLVMRTTFKMILDYNPSEEFHWIYDKVIPRDDASYYHSTYRDNPFLELSVIAEIEKLKDIDEEYWRVYGLGERGQSREVIFRTDTYNELPSGARFLAYGMDFGFAVDPTALVGVWEAGDALYVRQFIYLTSLTNDDIARQLTELGIGRYDEIVADSAEPKSIEEIHRMRFNIKPAIKGADSIRIGIDLMRRRKLYVHQDSLDLQKEFRNYKWAKDKNDKVLPKPVDAFNHGVDAVRYVCLMKLTKKTGQYFIR